MLITITGEITTDVEKELLSKLWEANEDVTIIINSGGGDGEAILATMPLIRRLEAKKHTVTTVCLGYAFSAAAMLLMLGTKGRRYMSSDAEVMIHRGTYNVHINGDAAPSTLERVKRNIERFEDFYVAHSDCLGEETHEWLRTDTYFLAEEAKEKGIIDHIGLPE
jgi:ATP-dependent Clp protease protease subunit